MRLSTTFLFHVLHFYLLVLQASSPSDRCCWLPIGKWQKIRRQDSSTLDVRTAEYWKGRWQNIGQQDSKTLDTRTAEFWK